MAVFAAGALLSALTRYFRGYQPRRLSAALTGVLTPADRGWILAGGVGVPFALHFLLDLGTPLGMHDQGISSALGSALFRYLVAGAVMFWLPLLMASRRLGCRLGTLGWDRETCCERRLLGWAAGILVTSGLFALAASESVVVTVMEGLAIFCGIALLIMLLLALAFVPRQSAVRWLALARAAVPAQVLGVLLMALSSLAFHAREKHWIRNDRLTRIEPSLPAANRHQFEAAEGLRKALLEAMGDQRRTPHAGAK
jgi:hypothetical protein